ncbi:MAG: hypothetical protein QOJ80_2169 [Mycobacterium sp.]|nr:hypothetical protein [Mycobacterium sp.]
MMMARRRIDVHRAYLQLLWPARRTRIPLSELAQCMGASPVHPDPPQDK